MYNWHITLFIIFVKYACADQGSGVQPSPPVKFKFLELHSKITEKNGLELPFPLEEIYIHHSTPPLGKNSGSVHDNYIFYVLMEYFY